MALEDPSRAHSQQGAPTVTSRRYALKHIAGSIAWLGASGCSSLVASASGAPPKIPPAVRSRNLQLLHNWDFRERIRTLQQLHAEFFTRYIYNNGRLDKLNDEWQRYRDNDNHLFEEQ